MDDFDIAQFKDLFISESHEYLRILTNRLLDLEQNPRDTEALQAMFRAAHSLKGSAAMMGFESIARVAHNAEDILDKLRSEQWALTSSLADLLLAAIDTLQAQAADIAADRAPSVDPTDLLQQMQTYSPQEPRSAYAPEAMDASSDDPPQPTTSDPQTTTPTPTRTLIRVDVRHLDRLLNVVTEMVIHRSYMERLAKRYRLTELNEALDVHHRQLAQLRDSVLDMRTVPLSHVFERYPRMVRDLLREQNKEARLLLEGQDVEMDRTALDALSEPLVHLLRNAIDHGLEPRHERVATGKPASGTLRLSAWRDRDTVVIEASDDGRGIDVDQVAQAALDRNLVSAQDLTEMNKEEILSLVCHPGFSLSTEVTAVSGRGVGMNIVKRQIERLRGSLQIQTQLFQGTTFRLRLPVSLSLMSALLVRVGAETYAIPMTAVDQIVELDQMRIDQVSGQDLLTLDEKIVPLQRLCDLLQVPDAAPNPGHALVMRRQRQPVGICVDEVEGHEEIVVKPLPEALQGTPGLSGVTILGEGQTVLILDEEL